ncbi:MAG: autoinducer binding domain-containing protein [Gemmobacter sp.]|nr:autoinducer binding domain-containing protein [Gemmobacter sp.]
MQRSLHNGDTPSLSAEPRLTDEDARLLEILPLIGDADTTETAVTLFREAVVSLGADAGVFMSCLSDDATRTSLGSLWACDPVWAAEYASRRLFSHDPWLRYATHESEPIFTGALRPASAEEEAFLATAATHGFASGVIAPAPSGVGTSRVGMLCIGSQNAQRFIDGTGAIVRVLARALAMELHRWLQHSMRKELLLKANLTDAELELLRHEAAGHSSKVIGATLKVEPTTIDCRFQRLNAKLDAPDRRTALRIARLYGLL